MAILILAAGKGTRMRSELPKVLHPLAGDPILFHILDRVLETSPDEPIGIVVGYGAEEVKRAVLGCSRFQNLSIGWIDQVEQKGTGHAAQMAAKSDWGKKHITNQSGLLVLPGDFPLISNDLISTMLKALPKGKHLRLLSAHFQYPAGYGRVVRKGGKVSAIVEHKDATEKQKQISEVALSIYLFQGRYFLSRIQKLKNQNAQKEFYLTDLIHGAAVESVIWSEVEEVQGVNTLYELAQARRKMNDRLVRMWAERGVNFIDPYSVWIDREVTIEEGVTLYPGTMLLGQTRIQTGTVIGPGCFLKDTQVGPQVELRAGVVAEKAQIESGTKIGPYAHLRPGSHLGSEVKIGNFVELKEAHIGRKTSIAHLSYVGDAEIGERVNIGCGFVTCNFDGREIDGRRKHKTVIEDDVFMGSDCQAVAPIKVGRGAYVASGSTITQDVEAEALAIARSRQVNKPGYAKRLKPKG